MASSTLLPLAATWYRLHLLIALLLRKAVMETAYTTLPMSLKQTACRTTPTTYTARDEGTLSFTLSLTCKAKRSKVWCCRMAFCLKPFIV
jgi:hypothetical protein